MHTCVFALIRVVAKTPYFVCEVEVGEGWICMFVEEELRVLMASEVLLSWVWGERRWKAILGGLFRLWARARWRWMLRESAVRVVVELQRICSMCGSSSVVVSLVVYLWACRMGAYCAP